MNKEIMIIGTKESFLIKSLERKMGEAGLACFFCKCEINAINRELDRAYLIAFYLDSTEHIRSDVFHFVAEQVSDRHLEVALIGERADTDEARKLLPGHCILEVFGRPLDADAFIHVMETNFHLEKSVEARKRILIVDEDTTYMGVIRDWLRDAYSVALANSGMQAITYLSKNPVDLILLDYEMPVTSGPQVLKMLRSEPTMAQIPVIFLTGHNDKESVMEVVSLKPAGYLLKTIQRGDLLKELKLFFQSR